MTKLEAQVAGLLCGALCTVACGSSNDGLAVGQTSAALDVGARVIDMTPPRFFPEGVTVDKSGNFFLGSMYYGSIYTAKADDGEAVPFIAAGTEGLVSVLGMYADDAHNTLWVCSSDAGNAELSGSAPVTMKAFEILDTGGALSGAFIASYDWPAASNPIDGAPVNGFCNDLSVDAEGNLYATDSWYPRILRLPVGGSALEEWVTSSVFPQDQWHLNGIDIDQTSDTVYVVENHPGALYSIPIKKNGKAGKVQQITTSRDLLSPDGLKVLSPNVLVTAEGANNGGGVAVLRVSGSTADVEDVIDGFDQVATLALHQGSAWVVENQADHFWNPGGAGPDADPPFRLVEVPLSAGAGAGVVTLDTPRLFPEGSTVDAAGNFYVGSMEYGDIVKIPAGSTSSVPFISADDDNGLVSALGMFADDASNTLYVCSSDAGNAVRSGSAPVAIKAFSLTSGELTGSWNWPAPNSPLPGATVNGFCNDIVVDSAGNLFATDSWYPRILTLPAGGSALEEWVVSDVFPQTQWHLNGIDIDEQRGRLYAVENHPGALYEVEIKADGTAGAVAEVPTSRPLLSPDGLKVVDKNLLAIAEGSTSGMALIEISGQSSGQGDPTCGSQATVGSCSGFVRRVSTGLDGIATFALQGGSAWLVENQADHFWNPGGAGPDASKPFRLVEVPLNAGAL